MDKLNDINHHCSVCGNYPARYYKFLKKAVCDKCFNLELMKWIKATTFILIPITIIILLTIKYNI